MARRANQAVKVVWWRVFLAVTVYLQGNTNCVNFQVGEFASPSTMFPARPVEDHLPQIRAWRGFIVMDGGCSRGSKILDGAQSSGRISVAVRIRHCVPGAYNAAVACWEQWREREGQGRL